MLVKTPLRIVHEPCNCAGGRHHVFTPCTPPLSAGSGKPGCYYQRLAVVALHSVHVRMRDLLFCSNTLTAVRVSQRLKAGNGCRVLEAAPRSAAPAAPRRSLPAGS